MVRGFRPTLITIGVIYTLMACSAVARGVSMLRDFGVAEDVIASPVLADFFSFFYCLMAFVGCLMIVFGLVVRERKGQRLVCAVFMVANLGFGYRDLTTSDSRFGNHLYKGEKTMFFVVMDVALALAFATLLVVDQLRSKPAD
ncbi:MAG: hypothetical protein U0271_38315 [Polyangiaceae bacterium]